MIEIDAYVNRLGVERGGQRRRVAEPVLPAVGSSTQVASGRPRGQGGLVTDTATRNTLS